MSTIPPVLYVAVMVIAVAGWLALIVFPRRPWANFWFAGIGVPLVLCLVYIYSLLTFWFAPPPMDLFGFLTLPGVAHMFTNRGELLVGWINILTMDLVVGAWMTRKAVQVKMPYVYLLPCLIATYVFAGVGFPLFCLIMALGGRWPAIVATEEPLSSNSAVIRATPRSTS